MKISEILKEAKRYHYAFGGSYKGMCNACLRYSFQDPAFVSEALDFCQSLVDSIEDSVYLSRALLEKGLPCDDDTVAMIWEAVIDKLEYDGK